ncbi:MAG: phosphatase PAP2 family protein [Dermatophilus congolensis]|nr:phosphatase PAP2 family protein [Dermatophilus congolensis]
MTESTERPSERARRSAAPALRWAWALIVGGVLGLAVVVPVSVWTHLGQRADERSRWSVALPADLRETLWVWLEQVSVPLIVLVTVSAAVVALVRRRPEQALAAALLVGAANVTTQLAKSLLPRAYYGIGAENTLPSGHMTVVVSLLAAVVLVLPRPLRLPMVGIASFVSTLAGATIVILRWHRPSDVVAAVGVCAFWYGVAVLVAHPWAQRRRWREAEAGPPAHEVRAPGAHREGHEWDDAARAVEAARPWRDRIVPYAVLALASGALSGVVLILGGLAAHEKPSNAAVGAIALSAAGLAVAGLMSMGASAADGLDAPARPHAPGHEPAQEPSV